MKLLPSDRYSGQKISILGFLISTLFGCIAFILNYMKESIPEVLYGFLSVLTWVGLLFGFFIVLVGIVVGIIFPFINRRP